MSYVILGSLLLLFLTLYLRARLILARQTQEVLYISRHIREYAQGGSQSYIRLPSSNEAIIKLAASANQVLSCLYRSRREAAEFQKNMQQMLTDVSHDLKTPLTVIHGYTEILTEKCRKTTLPDEITSLTGKLDQKTRETVRLMSQFFTLAKIQSGDMVLHPEQTDAGRLCREILLEYYDLLEERGYMVEFPGSNAPQYAMADAEALKRILKNLIDNAIKYGCEGLFLGISIVEDHDSLSILVEDHGKGIAPTEQERIFLRTYRREPHTRPDISGSGLGLSICKRLAEQMGGSLCLRDAPSGGNVFVLSLPKHEGNEGHSSRFHGIASGCCTEMTKS